MFKEETISLNKITNAFDLSSHCDICGHLFEDKETVINLGDTFGWKAQKLCCIPCKNKHADDILGFYRNAEAFFWELIHESL